jgi:hypothetical protein
VGTGDEQCGAGAFHENPRDAAFAADRSAANAGQLQFERSSDAVVAARQPKFTDTFIKGVLKCIRVISNTVSDCAKVSCLCHDLMSSEVRTIVSMHRWGVRQPRTIP